jgi:hypothetical protein
MVSSIKGLLRLPGRPRFSGGRPSEYAVRPSGVLREFTVRGDRARVTEAFFQTVRSLHGTPGLALIELQGGLRQWTSGQVPRSALLEALLRIRDLLGQQGLDTAVFSPEDAMEVCLDRFGTLEIRCGEWHEPGLLGVLQDLGFRGVPWMSAVPSQVDPAPPWTEEARKRFEAVRARLGLANAS